MHSVEFTIDGETVRQPAAYLTQPEGNVVLVVTEVPERWDNVTKMIHVAGPEAHRRAGRQDPPASPPEGAQDRELTGGASLLGGAPSPPR